MLMFVSGIFVGFLIGIMIFALLNISAVEDDGREKSDVYNNKSVTTNR